MQTAERLNSPMEDLGFEAVSFATRIPGDVANSSGRRHSVWRRLREVCCPPHLQNVSCEGLRRIEPMLQCAMREQRRQTVCYLWGARRPQ